jgi:hypothetical protein
VILGCTHYPLVRPMLQRMLGPARDADRPGAAIARRVELALEARGLASPTEGEGDYRFLSTGDPEVFRALGTRFLQMPLTDVTQVQLEAPVGAGGAVAGVTPERTYGRGRPDLRPVVIEPGFVRPAAGSALISCGETRVICTVSVSDAVPRWMAGRGTGWLTAEYGMLPASTGRRKERPGARGGPTGARSRSSA